MTQLNDLPFSALQFYTTAPYSCSYLSGNVARSQVATPSNAINTRNYSYLINRGFRRSGSFTYRPLCEHCNSCVPVRINVETFQPRRSQKRAWSKNKHLKVRLSRPTFLQEHYLLYSKYQNVRHSGGGMDADGEEQYKHFLLQTNVDSLLVEFRDRGELKIVSIIDKLENGISSVYTFYDPTQKTASFGIFSILWQIEFCRIQNLQYIYLGYWIKDSKKMAYKTLFRPIEALVEGKWVQFFNE